MLKYLLSIAFPYVSLIVKGQQAEDWNIFFQKIRHADSLYQKGEYVSAAKGYSTAFTLNNQHFSEGSRFDAARAWARIGKKDSAFFNLKLDVQAKFHDLKKLKEDPAFTSLYKSEEWKKIINSVKANEEEDDKRLGKFKKVKQDLEAVLISDQAYRIQYDSVLATYGAKSERMNSLLSKMKEQDEKNMKYVSTILDENGWIDYKLIGFPANSALFLVLQHADSATQEKYLPVMKKAVQDKKAVASHLALLEDRILLRRGQKQIYGSQINCDSTGKNCWIFPIEDEENVDKRRSEIGLPPLAEYVKHWNIVYRKPE